MSDGQAISIHNPTDTNLTPAGEGGGCEVNNWTIKDISSSWNLKNNTIFYQSQVKLSNIKNNT